MHRNFCKIVRIILIIGNPSFFGNPRLKFLQKILENPTENFEIKFLQKILEKISKNKSLKIKRNSMEVGNKVSPKKIPFGLCIADSEIGEINFFSGDGNYCSVKFPTKAGGTISTAFKTSNLIRV